MPTSCAAISRRAAKLLLAEGLDPEALQRAASDSPHGAALLRRFAQLLRD